MLPEVILLSGSDGLYETALRSLLVSDRRRDPWRAAKLLTVCAEDGDPRAMVMLGRLHEHGQGVERDLMQAVLWYLAGAARTPVAALREFALAAARDAGALADEEARGSSPAWQARFAAT